MFNLRVRSDLIKLPVTQHPTQIIVQLINNALSHGLEHDGHLRIEINKNHESNGVLVNIIDDGRGIDKGEIDRVFEPFFTSKCAADKVGLGLTITHNLVLGKMRGEIKVSSVLNEGCCFSLQLPNLH
jgi:signal transduction histidine kinase